MYLILPARDLGNDFAVGVQQIHQRVQVLAHRIEQRRALQLRGHHDKRPVGDDVVGERAALGVLTVAINVDAFRQPLIDPAHEACVWKEVVRLRERGADDPTVVRRVDAAGRHPLPRFQQEGPERGGNLRGTVQAADRRRRRDVVNDEPCVRRRVEVRGEQIDIALRALRALKESGGEADAFE